MTKVWSESFVSGALTIALANYREESDSLAVISNTSPALTDIDCNNNRLVNVLDPTADQDVATKKYVDDNISGGGMPSTWTLNDIQTNNPIVSSLVISGQQVIVDIDPVIGDDLTRKSYVDSAISTGVVTKRNQVDSLSTISTNALALSDIDCNSQKITNLATPTLIGDAVP